MKIKKKDLINLVKILQEKLDNAYNLKVDDLIDISGNFKEKEIEKEYILPKKWACYRPGGVKGETLNAWTNKFHSDKAMLSEKGYIFSDRCHSNYNEKEVIFHGYTIISYEEFEKYVLNEDK